MTDVLVYVAAPRAQAARTLLGAACKATGVGVGLEILGTGSLYQRLGPRKSQPLPDIVMWFGPYAARAAAADTLLQPHQPARIADGAPHDPDWRWTSFDYSPVGVIGPPLASGAADLASVPRLAMADPERSEAGLSILLATLVNDVEGGWQWWRQRAQRGLLLTEDEQGALDAVNDGLATNALALLDVAAPVSGLAPLPHAVGLAANSRNIDAARRVLDWLNGPDAATLVRYSAWQASANGLQSLLAAAPPVDADWGRAQYAAARARWAQSGFGPTLPAQ